MDIIKEAINRLLKSLIDPVISVVLRLSWWKRLFVFFIVVGASLSLQYQEKIQSSLLLGVRLYRVATAPPLSIPLSDAARSRLNQHLSLLTVNLQADIQKKWRGETLGYTPWPIAQVSVALNEHANIDPNDLERFWLDRLDKQCNCWRETRLKEPHLGATSWVLYAFANLDLPHVDGPEQYLLSNQKISGWWPVHPSTFQDKNASTYATAWALLAINAHFNRGHYVGKNKENIQHSIQSGISWLQKVKIKDRARWLDYPYGTNGINSISISGLIMHFFHQFFSRENLIDIDRQWLAELPIDLRSASENEMSDSYVLLKSGDLDFDKTRHYKLPWVLMATIDSYPNGTLFQKANALKWIEDIMAAELADGSVLKHNWIAAELTISLRQLSREIFKRSK